jgi:hypothetical protein
MVREFLSASFEASAYFIAGAFALTAGPDVFDTCGGFFRPMARFVYYDTENSVNHKK